MNRPAKLFPFLLGGVTAGLVFWLVPYGEELLALRFAPVYLRSFFWPSAYSFVAGLAGIFVFILTRLAASRLSLVSGGIVGIALGLVLFSFSQVSRAPDNRIDWVAGEQDDLIAMDRDVQARAAREGRPILYYFRADWCAICPEFERLILSRVAADTGPFLAVKMDVTDFDRWDEYLAREYHVAATPTVVLRDRSGRILEGTHFTGEHVSVRAFRAALRTLARPLEAGQPGPGPVPAPSVHGDHDSHHGHAHDHEH